MLILPISSYQEFHQRMNELENQVEPSYNCVGEACIDPMDGSGTYSSLAACEYCLYSPASIDELKTQDIQVYPNPNNGTFTLQVVSLESANMEYKNIDIQGKTIVTTMQLSQKGLNNIEMKKNLKAGLYFIEIANERIKIRRSITKDKSEQSFQKILEVFRHVSQCPTSSTVSISASVKCLNIRSSSSSCI